MRSSLVILRVFVGSAVTLVATAAFGESAAEMTARFARVTHWSGKFACSYERVETPRDDGFTVGSNKTKVSAEGHVRYESGGTFTLVREKNSYGDGVRWVLDKHDLRGLMDLFGAQMLGSTRLEEKEFGNKIAPPEPPCVPGPTPEEACPEQTGEVLLQVQDGRMQLSCPVVKVVATLTKKFGSREAPPEESIRQLPGCVNIDEALPSGTLRLAGVSKTSGDFGIPLSVRSGVFQDDIKCEWSLEPGGQELAQEPIVEGPRCTCSPDGVIELTAKAASGSEGGTFTQWEVKSSGKGATAKVLTNEGGAKPRLLLSGDGSKVGETAAVAVYKKGGAVLRSAPFPVSFCRMEELKLLPSKNRHAEGVYVFGAEEDVFPPEGIRVEAKVRVNGQDRSEAVKWTFSPNPDGAWETKGMKAGTNIFRLREMPETVSEFGEKRLTATFEGDGCAAAKEKTVRAFFARDARTNPGKKGAHGGDKQPNWAHYWGQTSAGKGFAFEVVKYAPDSIAPCTDLTISEVREPSAVAFYDWCRDVLFLRQHLVGPVPGISGWGCAKRPDGSSDLGIDCFAVNVRHEARHQEQFTAWWGPKMSRYTIAKDSDADKVPDDVEDATPGCNPLAGRSCPGRPTHLKYSNGKPADLLDLEMDAYLYGWKWQRGAADKEDWACPGKQCP